MTTYDNVLFFKVNIYKHIPMLADLGVTVTPTFKVFNFGELVDTFEGESSVGDLELMVADLDVQAQGRNDEAAI